MYRREVSGGDVGRGHEVGRITGKGIWVKVPSATMEFSLLPVGKTAFSLEFFPPKDEAGEARLWNSLDQVKELAPDFVSVTYGAGGGTRDRTIRITREITSRSGLSTVAHLTCVGSTSDEIDGVLDGYSSAGIRSILALRGDPVGGPLANWVKTEGGFHHADQLVERAHQRGFEVGVAAFPDGHPASKGDFAQDVQVLKRKHQLGATFATTQFFFDLDRFLRLRDALHRENVTMPLIAGLLPITNYKQLVRMAELSGADLPEKIVNRILEVQHDPEEVKRRGIEIAIKLGQGLLREGVAGLHFYTMNSSDATVEIVRGLGLR